MSNPNSNPQVDIPVLPEPPLITVTSGPMETIRQIILNAYYNNNLNKTEAETTYGIALAMNAMTISVVAIEALNQCVIEYGSAQYLLEGKL